MSPPSVPDALRTAAYAAYFPVLLVALVALPVALVEAGLQMLDAVQYALLGVGVAYVAGLGVLFR